MNDTLFAIAPSRWYILDRQPGGVLDTFHGTETDVAAELDRRNATDQGGTTFRLASFDSEDDCRTAFNALL